MTTEALPTDASLLHGWLPVTVELTAVAILVLAMVGRSGRWSVRWLPIALLFGVGLSFLVHWYIAYQGWSDNPAPWRFWVWIALSEIACLVLLAGWRASRWWQRVCSLAAIPLCLLCVALALNLWVGYLPTMDSAWRRITGAPLGGQIDAATFQAMRGKGAKPIKGTVLSVTIPDQASGFKHRDELVYLPPAWYATVPPPQLPVVMMIGGEFGRPDDWPSVGAEKVLDDFAAGHGGNAPVVVWVDQSGTFSNDTECVNGTRGNAADHLTRDVVPYLISNFGVSSDPAHWGIAGWSAGGTCALTLTLKYPHLFSAFVDVDGQLGPTAGTKQQTIHRLFGGDGAAWAAFDPQTIMAEHGPYQGIAGWFAVSEPTSSVYRPAAVKPAGGRGVPADPPRTGDIAAVAHYMCQSVSSYGIGCAVVSLPGKHDLANAVRIFDSALPWLAGRLGTPGAAAVPFPGAAPS